MAVMALLDFIIRQVRISPEAVGRTARFACRVAIRLPDGQREEPCAARSQEVERSIEGCGIAAVDGTSLPWGPTPLYPNISCISWLDNKQN